MILLIIAGASLVFWLVTTGFANGCTVMGQLNGETCIPMLATLHGLSALATGLLVVGAGIAALVDR